MRLTLCLEGNGEGRVLASISMEEIVKHLNLSDTIRDIHDNVAREMYCKGIDDFAKNMKYEYGSDEIHETIERIAEQLKEQICQ